MTVMSGADRSVAFVVTTGFEQVELTKPWQAVKDAGGTPVLVSPEDGTVQAFDHIDRADTFDVDVSLESADEGDYVALVVPGGVVNADFIRTDEQAIAFTQAFFEAGKPVAVICHGPWLLIEADQVKGKRMTSYPSLRTDLRNAGANWVDEEVVVDGNLITSRGPHDLEAFSNKLVEAALSA